MAKSELERACGRLERVCGLLESACGLLQKASPEALEQSAPLLKTVTQELRDIQEAEAIEIGIEGVGRIQILARRIRFLLDSATRFHSRWQTILAGMTDGYNAAGVPAATPRRGRRLRISG